MCARDLSARVMDPAQLDSSFWRELRALKQSMERKTKWFWLCSAGYLWRGSIHPFVLCGQGQCGWEFWEVKALNEVTTLPKHVGGQWGPLEPLAFKIQGALKYTHMLSMHKTHNENKQDLKRDSWPLPPSQLLLFTFLLWDKLLSANWPTFSFSWLHCAHEPFLLPALYSQIVDVDVHYGFATLFSYLHVNVSLT